MTVYTVTGNEEKYVKKWSNSEDCGNNSSKNGESHMFVKILESSLLKFIS